MKLSEYINKYFNGKAGDYARAHNFHLTQVNRFLDRGAEYGEPPYFKKYLKEKSNVTST